MIKLPGLGQAAKSYSELQGQYGESVDDLCADHEQLIEQILEEEE